MNIFVLSLQIIECAMFHCDQHVIKMILESAQMLCSACILSGGKAEYALAHKSHPCTKWALLSLSNWRWLKELATALNKEYQFRYKKEINHRSLDVINRLEEPNIPDIGLTEFAQAMPDEFKDPDPVTAYRKYYAGAKYRFATWKMRDIPQWYIELRKEFGGDAIAEVKSLLDPTNMKEKRKVAREINKEKKKEKIEKNEKKEKKEKKVVTKEPKVIKNAKADKITEKASVLSVKTRKMLALEEQKSQEESETLTKKRKVSQPKTSKSKKTN